MTDYAAANTTDRAFNAGSDVMMGTLFYRLANTNSSWYSSGPGFGTDLLPFLANSSVSLARLDDAATRILSTYHQYQLDNKDRPAPATEF